MNQQEETLAETAFSIARKLGEGDILYLADDEQQAEALACALKGLVAEDAVFFIPSSDALPGDVAPASPANTGQRVAALHALRQVQQQVDRSTIAVVLSGEGAARPYPAPRSFDDAPPMLRSGDAIDLSKFTEQAQDLGYFGDDRIDEPGEIAIRGEVIDIFPADAGIPSRIDVADGRITAIRCYDPATQRTLKELDELRIGRAAEPRIADPVAITAHMASATILRSPKADRRRQRFIKLATDHAERSGGRVEAIDDAAWQKGLEGWRSVEACPAGERIPSFAEGKAPLAAMARFARPLLEEGRVLVLAGSARDVRYLRSKVARRLHVEIAQLSSLKDIEAMPAGAAGCIVMPVDTGFVDDRAVIISASDILGSRAQLSDSPASGTDSWTGSGAEIRVGDIVVHEDHGVGRVAGLTFAPATDADGQPGEMIALEYAAKARRLVSVVDADRIWRYGTDADAVSLDKLDGSSWLKRRLAIDTSINESARALTEVAKARAKLKGVVIDPDAAAYERFAHGFPFNETPDQSRAIAAVRADLASGKPMNRLIVGDVGYGKTEVAMRAAGLAALAGFQVVIAAPTTVLVRQHIDNFTRRFEASGIRVAGLSRLSSAAEKKAVKAGLADGSIRIVVGTGAVMARDVRYANLGLVVIDEEQRFGAADKTKLRGSGETHLLTLSATPIPRTLQMAMIGLQQLSAITTPPARRQPIRTSLDHYDDARIRTALLREKGRGGQSFIVVPRIEHMAALADKLRRIVPDLRVIEAHGKMPPADIDEAMVGFAGGDGDILLATNIIEAGLDVPRANTMIVWSADRLGLAQLHQLRGRVGRGHRRGQIILLTDGEQEIAERTLKRLRTLAAHDRLGSGFDISAHDLDMRGGGDLIGDSQAGHLKLIGTHLYQHLLGMALRAARGEDVEHWSPELHVGAQGSFPESWIPEADVRLGLYVRLSRIRMEAALEAFEEELVDRFGPLPPAAATLMDQARIRVAARALDVGRIDAGAAAIALTPRRGFTADPATAGLKAKDGRLLLAEPTKEGDRAGRVQTLLETLAA